MHPLLPGSMLLHKYRVERLRLESRRVVLYEATDTIRGGCVCIKIFRDDSFSREARAANVIDVGTTYGLPYVVAHEWTRSVPIPIYVDEEALVASSRPLRRASPWAAAFLAIAAVTGVGAWLIGRQSDAPATPIVTPLAEDDTDAMPPAPPATATMKPKRTASVEPLPL